MSVRYSRCSKEETCQRILQKADQLFHQYGFGKTTVAEIAAELGMSPANIYKFFSSKDALVQACANRNLDRIRDEITSVATSGEPVGDRVESVALILFKFHRDLFKNEREIFKLVVRALEEAWDCIDTFRDFLTAVFESLLKEGMVKGEVKKADPAVLTTALLDALHIAFYPHLRHGWGSGEKEDRVRAHIALAVSGLR